MEVRPSDLHTSNTRTPKAAHHFPYSYQMFNRNLFPTLTTPAEEFYSAIQFLNRTLETYTLKL